MLMHNKVLHDGHTLYAVHLKYEVSSNIPAFSFSAFKLGTLTGVSDKNMSTFSKLQLYRGTGIKSFPSIHFYFVTIQIIVILLSFYFHWIKFLSFKREICSSFS